MGDILTGLKGHWKLDEASGVVAADSSGNGRNGSLINFDGDEWIAAKINNGLQFSQASKDYVEVDHHADFSVNNFSVACWIKFNSLPEAWTLCIVKGPGNDRNFNIQASATGAVYAGFEEEGGVNHFAMTATGYITTGVWYHLVFTYNGSVVKLYKDSVNTPGYDHSTSTTPATNTFKVTFGRYSLEDRFYLDGVMDDIRVYNRALTQGDIDDLYALAGVVSKRTNIKEFGMNFGKMAGVA